MVMSMMHGVIFASHDGLGVAIHGIMDVGGPDSREEDHNDMGQVVARDKEKPEDIRGSLSWGRGTRYGWVVCA